MLNIVNVDIESIFLDPANARKHGKKNLDSIKGSIKKFGQVEPLVVNKENRVVIGGNGRLVAMKELGFKTVSIVEIDINTVDATALGIALNRTGELAEWDLNNLGPLLKDLDIDLLADIGFDAKDLEKLMPELVKEGLCDEDEVPEVTDTRCKPGDLWQLGNHRLLCGDSTNVQHVERLMGGEKADMVFTDPPYGIEYDDKTRKSWTKQSETAKQNNFGQIKNDDVEVGEFVNAILGYFDYCNRIFIWGILNGNGNVPKGSFIVWDRKTEAMADCPFGDFDICWSKNVGWKMIRVLWGGYISKEKGENRLHPTQKPIALVNEFFERWGKPNDLVADLFLGSGSTLIACEKTNRRCFGLEIDPHYCSVILARWEKFTGQQAKLLST